jgi:hypothetical protein
LDTKSIFFTEVYVKRLAFFLFISVLFAGTVFAQNKDNRQNRNDRRQEVTNVTIEGVLKLEKGIVAVASGDSVYYVPILSRYIGFIEGLKEGTKVSVEGSKINDFIRPVKVTINGKSYDFPEYGKRDNDNRFSQGRDNFRQPRNLNDRGRQARPFGRNGFGSCCR